MTEYRGWLFDIYERSQNEIAVWLIGEDGKPYCFHQNFELTFYVSGTPAHLHELGEFLWSKYPKQSVKFERVTLEELFDGPREQMGIRVSDLIIYKGLLREAQGNFPDLIYSNVDAPLSLRYAAKYNVFMMAHCIVSADADNRLISINALDNPRDLEPALPKLRVLHLRPDPAPAHKQPKHLFIHYNNVYARVPFARPRELLNLLNHILTGFDPDVIQTHFGDTWLFAHLEAIAKGMNISFNPNRDLSLRPLKLKEISFFNYGRAHYRGPQIHLRGRWHVDLENCMTYAQYGLVGAIEQVRMSSLPLQGVARRSPGASIAAMQDLTAMRRGVLIPHQRQKGEIPKTYNQLVRADRGGLVLKPPIGVFGNVAVLDFASLMASIMIKWNVSPETVVSIDTPGDGYEIPDLGIKILSRLGLIPETLKPMRDKRIALKRWLKSIPKDDPRYRDAHRRYKPVVDGLKWLAVVCYGRLGFANSTFGRVNAHEAVSYLSRQVIRLAKGIAEANGFDVLHVYVDSIFVTRPDASREDFQKLAEQIEHEIDLPMDVENVYSWFGFPCSRENPNLSVANRFFGIAADGKHKIRGLALRRHDTPEFVSRTQMGVIKILSAELDPAKLADHLPEVLDFVQHRLASLSSKEVPLRQLVVTQTLSREVNEYSVLSPLAAAARQLQVHGKTPKMGQDMRMIYIAPAPGVSAWDAPTAIDPRIIDVPRYRELILRAVHDVLHPIGVDEKTLRDWLFSKAGYVTRPGILSPFNSTKVALPIFKDIKRLVSS